MKQRKVLQICGRLDSLTQDQQAIRRGIAGYTILLLGRGKAAGYCSFEISFRSRRQSHKTRDATLSNDTNSSTHIFLRPPWDQNIPRSYSSSFLYGLNIFQQWKFLIFQIKYRKALCIHSDHNIRLFRYNVVDSGSCRVASISNDVIILFY